MSVEAVDGADASGRELERGAAVAHTGSGRSLKELKQVNWSSEVSSVLNGRQPDEGDPLLREYFGVHDLYTKQLEVRLASERTRDEGTYLRLLAIEGEGEEELERAVELLAAELPPQVASPNSGSGPEPEPEPQPQPPQSELELDLEFTREHDVRELQLFATDPGAPPSQSRPERLWRLHDGLLESKVDSFVICVEDDRSLRARKLSRGEDRQQMWTLTDSQQLRHNNSGLLLRVRGDRLVAEEPDGSGDNRGGGGDGDKDDTKCGSVRWVVHRHDVQTLQVQVRAKRSSKWREGRQRVMMLPLGRLERVAASARDDPRFTMGLSSEELDAVHEIVSAAVQDGHAVRDLLLRVQALAETKWEEGSVRQCTQIYTECAMALLNPLGAESASSDTRHALHEVATNADPRPAYLIRLEEAGHASTAAEVAKEHETGTPSTEALEAALQEAMVTGADHSIERCVALRKAFGRDDVAELPAQLSQLTQLTECTVELHRTAAQIAASYEEGDVVKESFKIVADPFTGLPCFGIGVKLQQLDPEPPRGIDEGMVDCQTARRVTLGPLPPHADEWELSWDEVARP